MERWNLEFDPNTTEKFQNSLKNLKTHEAQLNEFQFGIATLPSVMSMEKFGPTCFWLKMGQLTGAAMYYRLREWVYVDREVRSEK